MDPHGVSPSEPRAGNLPEKVLATIPKDSSLTEGLASKNGTVAGDKSES